MQTEPINYMLRNVPKYYTLNMIWAFFRLLKRASSSYLIQLSKIEILFCSLTIVVRCRITQLTTFNLRFGFSPCQQSLKVRVKKRNTPIYSNPNCCWEIKPVPIIMDYCQLQFEALKFSLGVSVHGRSLLNLAFSK